MKKLKLDDLEVTSFATTAFGAEMRGTLHAHGDPIDSIAVGEVPNLSEIRCGPTGLAIGCTVGCSYVTMCAAACPTNYSDCFCLPPFPETPVIPIPETTRGWLTGEIVVVQG